MGIRDIIAAGARRYSIRIGGQLRLDLAAASAKYCVSESEIFRMAVRKARRVRTTDGEIPGSSPGAPGFAVAGENNVVAGEKDDTTTSEEAKVLHVYEFDPMPENDERFFRSCLREYLAAHDLTPVEEPAPGSAEAEYIRQCTRTAAELIREAGAGL